MRVCVCACEGDTHTHRDHMVKLQQFVANLVCGLSTQVCEWTTSHLKTAS